LTAGWILAAVQLGIALLILALPIANALKLIAFAILWGTTFRRLSPRELLCFAGVSALFSIMDVMAVRQGAFRFLHPDIGGLPLWEFFIWGFYVLHVVRALDGPAPPHRWRFALPLAILFALPFATVSDSTILLVSSAAALIVALAFFHERPDLVYTGYTVLLGAAFEYVGVWCGQWEYASRPPGGVDFWFIPMWAGIGLFTRRLLLPWVYEPRRS
jgi:hypothetical protein